MVPAGWVEDVLGAEAAANELWRAIDAYDPKGFAAGSTESAHGEARTPSPESVDSTVMDLHQKYGGRPRRVGSLRNEDGTVEVTTTIGDDEDALEFTMRRVGAAWKLATIHSAGPK